MGTQVTEGLGAGSQPDVGAAAAEEVIDEIRDHLSGAHMVFVTAGMGGGTGTGAAPVIAKTAREMGILTVGVVTKPFHFEGQRRMRTAESGIAELHKVVDTLLIIPNQNLFRVANEKTTFADAFAMADQVLYSGVACITDLMVKEGLINLDFADVRAVMREMGKAMMGTGEASGEKRALTAAEAAIANPLIDDSSMKGARGLLISITGGKDLTLFEVDEAATRIREEVDQDANIIVGATFDETLDGVIRVSVVATGIEQARSRATRSGSGRSAAAPARLHAGQPSGRSDRAAARRQCSAWPSAPRSWKRRAPRRPAAAAPQRARAASSARRWRRSPRRSRRKPRQPAAPLQPASYGDVTVRPIAQKPSLFPDHDVARSRDPRAGDARHLHPAGGRACRRSARRACRSSRICRCRRRTKSARRAAKPTRSIRRRAGCRCCSGSPMSASAAATKRPSRRSRPAPRSRRCRRMPERKPQRTVRRSRSRRMIRCRSMPGAPRRRVWTSTAARHLLPRATGRRPSGYPGLPAPPGQLMFVTILTTKKAPAHQPGPFSCAAKVAVGHKQLILND